MDQLGKVELVLVPVTHRVRTLHFAELALKALVHDVRGLLRRELPHIAGMALIDEGEERRETVAILEAEPASVTDLEGAFDLLVERYRVPVLLVRGVIGEPVRGLIRDRPVSIRHHDLQAGSVLPTEQTSTGWRSSDCPLSSWTPAHLPVDIKEPAA